jgi:hypothetical protein
MRDTSRTTDRLSPALPGLIVPTLDRQPTPAPFSIQHVQNQPSVLLPSNDKLLSAPPRFHWQVDTRILYLPIFGRSPADRLYRSILAVSAAQSRGV